MPKESSPTESQEKKILQWMQQGKYLTPMVALKEFGCFRLGARIWDCKKHNPDLVIITDTVHDEKTERAMKGKSISDFSKEIIPAQKPLYTPQKLF